LAALEAELQCLDDDRWARSVDGAHDLLRRLGDLTVDELRARSIDDFSTELVRRRRAALVRVAGEERLIAAEDAGRYRDALGVQPPPGLPDAFLDPVDDALVQLVRRWARTHGPFTSADPAARFGLPLARLDELLPEMDTIARGAFRPEGVEREWCDNEVLRLLRQRSLAALRREVEPTEVDALARFLPAWQGVGGEGRGIDRAYEVISQLQGVPVPASVLERDVLSSRVRDYSPRLLDDLLAAGEVMWVGAGPIGRDDGKVRLLLREHAPLLLQRLASSGGDAPDGPEHQRLRAVLSSRGACFFRELGGGPSDDETVDALWDLVWAGEVTNDSFAAVRALAAKKRSGGKARGGRPRLGNLTALGPPKAQGRWSLVASEVGEADPTRAAHTLAGVLLERHGVLTREAVRGEGVPGGFAAVYPVLRAMEEAGRIRRGYFVAGLGGAQFALPGAVDRLRQFRDPSSAPKAQLLAATDPGNPYGLALPWPVRGAQRAAGAHVVLIDGEAALYVEKGGRGLVALRELDGSWESAAVTALDELLAEGRFKRISVERCPDELEPVLREHGYVSTPKGLVKYA
jgi:ATP-dependent Lhr-like helicase